MTRKEDYKFYSLFLSRHSGSVANELENAVRYSATIELIQISNDDFDVLNIRYRSEGWNSRNKYKMPHRISYRLAIQVHRRLS